MPNNYSNIKSANDSAISTRDQLAKSILNDNEKIRDLEQQIREAKTKGESTSQLELDKQAVVNNLNANKGSLTSTNSTLDGLRADYENFIDHTQVVSNLSDTIPILLFPVRLETRFHKDTSNPVTPVYELWLRIFPDDVEIEAHEPALTPDEITEAKKYWTDTWNVSDPVKRINAWDVVCRKYTSQRAAFIITMLEPDNVGSPSPPNFPLNSALEKKYTSWTKAPETRVMPDMFVANLYDTYDPAIPPIISQQGRAIPFSLKVGIDPHNENSLKRNGTNMDASADIKWLIDFQAAIDCGMGMKIPLTQQQYDTGFERITVLGVKALANELQGKEIVEGLIDNHHYNTGFSILKQGTNTKNSKDGPSGYTDYEFGNVLSHNVERETKKVTNVMPLPTSDFFKNDGQRLAEALGINPAIFDHIYSADGFDIRNAMNMNASLFTATICYTMNVVMHPAFANVSVYDPTEETREYVTRYARSRGALPGIRIKKQPYGILPTSAFSKWLEYPNPQKPYYDDLYDVTSTVSNTWNSTVPNVKIAGDSDSQQAFVDALGRHAVSKEYYSRYGVGPNYIWNNLVFNDMPAEANQWRSDMQMFGQNISSTTGFNFLTTPYALQMNFKQEHGKVISGLIDTQPLSDTNPIEPIGASNINYLQWIRMSNLVQLRDEDFGAIGQAGATPPDSMLYLFMRQSFLLEYFNAACSILNLSEEQKREYEIINIYNVPVEGEGGGNVTIAPEHAYQSGPSRWAVFDMPFGPPGQTIGMFLDSPVGTLDPAMANLVQMRECVSQLENLPTAELALLFTEHLDFCSFRLDSWKLGFMNRRLNDMRLFPDGSVKQVGIYVGAYGWVENVTKNERDPVQSPGLPGEYYDEVMSGIEENPGNKGFIHAPSLNQAIAAAVLRAGYEAKASSADNKNHEVNLTSERVRKSMDIFAGIKNGQKLAALLGYEFERALHDTASGLELDKFIYPFRTKYKLAVLTAEYEGAIDQVSAINVLDGKKILEDYKTSNDSVFTNLDINFTLENPDKNEIKKELQNLLGILDAVGDMAVSEGVFQLVNNNYESAHALSSSLSGGTNPPDAQVIKTPRDGISLTNKIIKQFIPSVYTFVHNAPLLNTWSANLSKSHRAVAEPSLNEWLITRLPDPATIEIYTSFENTSPGVLYKRVYLSDLGIQPIDLLYMTQDTLANNESELAQRIKLFVRNNMGFAFDKEITIEYEEPALSNKTRFYDIHSYIVYLKKVITDSRYLNGSDFAPAGSDEAGTYDLYDYEGLYKRINTLINGDVDPTVPPPAPPTSPPRLFPNDYFVYGLVQIKMIIDDEIGYISGATPPAPAPVIPTPLADRLLSLSDALLLATSYGIERAIPKAPADASAAAVADILDAARSASEQIAKKLAAVLLVFTSSNTPAPNSTPAPTDENIAGYVPLLVQCAEILLGKSFRILPLTKVQGAVQTALNLKFITGSHTLLNDHSDPMLMDGWLSGVSRVRKKVANLEMMSVLNDVVKSNSTFDSVSFQPFQLPYDDDSKDRWQAVSVSDVENIKPGRLCLAISKDNSADYSGFITGMVIDDWTEVIPNKDETTGLAFHYDQPESKPPQALLLAIPPVFDGSWNWSDLLSVVNETFDEAKTRSIDYETVAATPYGHLLPALCVPVSDGAMTIGPDFITIENMY